MDMPPMGFREFAASTDGKARRIIADKLPPSPDDRLMIIRGMADGAMDERLDNFWLSQGRLDVCLDNYLLTGGTPAVADEFARTARISSPTYEARVREVAGDLPRGGADMARVLQLVPGLVGSLSAPVPMRSLAGRPGLKSHHTVDAHVGALLGASVLSAFHRYDRAGDAPRPGAGRKLYFQDPFTMHALHGQAERADPYRLALKMLVDPAAKRRLVEQAVADHCRRLALGMPPGGAGFPPGPSVFYWQGRHSREVDFVMRDGGSLIPVDVGYRDHIGVDDMRGLFDFGRATGRDGGIMVTKDEVGVRRGIAMIPASIFLLLV